MLRLAAQRLVGERWDTPADAVRGLTAVQAQDFPGALCSVALRTRQAARAAVEAALDAGEVVRSWPMRGTLHLVAAEDLGWLVQTLAPRVLRASTRRRADLGLDEAALEHGRELSVEALDGPGLRRGELLAYWDAHGLSTSGQRGYHLLGYLAQTGTLCLGPLQDGEQRIVLVEQWIPSPRRLERDEALGELALGYFRGHGPATVKDLIRWANLVAADARAGTEAARSELMSVVVDGIEYLMDPQTPQRLDAARAEAEGVLLLPGFDELVLGYADRTMTVPAQFAERIVPGGNGVFRPTVISGGRAVGTWRRAHKTIDAVPFTSFEPPVADAIPAVFADLP
ncbi:MAG TPA: winged helix DNA-binding domain-containing protein [Nocardioidaceae bacterium]|nr:winged helix DNA-binding domain-containing protein [Nocardioidaceae bacterium]